MTDTELLEILELTSTLVELALHSRAALAITSNVLDRLTHRASDGLHRQWLLPKLHILRIRCLEVIPQSDLVGMIESRRQMSGGSLGLGGNLAQLDTVEFFYGLGETLHMVSRNRLIDLIRKGLKFHESVIFMQMQ